MTENESLTRFTVMSSRIRLARNVEGLPFPRFWKGERPELMAELAKGAQRAASGLFDCDLYLMSELSKAQKTALVERHIISLPLANNTDTGAVILQRGSESMSIMLNEEDHIREQCVIEGFGLEEAYSRIDRYDDALLNELPIAYDKRLGFITACPTNLGTGMRASVMLFLPALKLAGGIEDALTKFIARYGLTVRGVYGEGSAADGDMYQISNTRSLGLSEAQIIDIIGRAALELCGRERSAAEKLASEKGAQLIDKIWRSYGIITNAYSISSSELLELISDVKLGVIYGILPVKDTRPLDKLVLLCSAASLSLKIGECDPRERDILRAKLVKGILAEVK